MNLFGQAFVREQGLGQATNVLETAIAGEEHMSGVGGTL